MKSEFRPWPEEEAFVQAQTARRAGGLEPEAIPDELQNWRERADDEVRRLIEEQARQREIMLRTLWENFEQVLQKYQNDRSAYQREFHPEQGEYHLSRTEQLELAQMKEHLKKEYGKNEVQIELIEQPDLIGGFVIRVKDREEDWSMKGRLNKLKQELIWR